MGVKMTDDKLVTIIANIWIILGGDKEGFEILQREIAEKILEVIK
jgi:hypothetical protein